MSAVAAFATPQPTPADAPATPGIALTTQLAGQSALLPAGVLALLVSLHRAVEPERQRRLQARRERQARFDA
ncbi:malate synthase A, partial [Stenotrophomonas sp. 278]